MNKKEDPCYIEGARNEADAGEPTPLLLNGNPAEVFRALAAAAGEDVDPGRLNEFAAYCDAPTPMGCESMNPFEYACREWVRGCTCAPTGQPWKCEECTLGFHGRIVSLIENSGGEVDPHPPLTYEAVTELHAVVPPGFRATIRQA